MEDTIKHALPRQVWDTLSGINVNDKTERKGRMTYLSWAWAWGILMEYYPESSYHIHPDKVLPNGSVMVHVTLTVKQGEEAFSRDMWLPVMDYNNRAITNPDAMAVNKAYMRCLTKAIAMCGLGHYIYAGDDLPEEDKPLPAKQELPPRSNNSAPKNTPSSAPKQSAAEKFLANIGNKSTIEDANEYWGIAGPYIKEHENHRWLDCQQAYELRLAELANL